MVGSSLGLEMDTLIDEIRLYDPLDIGQIVQALKQRKLAHDRLIGSPAMKLYLLTADVPYLNLDYDAYDEEYTLSIRGVDPNEVARSIGSTDIEEGDDYATFYFTGDSLVQDIDIIHKTSRSPFQSLVDISATDVFMPIHLSPLETVNTSLQEFLMLLAPSVEPIESLSTLLTTLQWRNNRLDSLRDTMGYKLYQLTQGKRLVLREVYRYTNIEVNDRFVEPITQLLGDRVISVNDGSWSKTITTDIPNLIPEVTEVHRLSLSIAKVLQEDTESNRGQIIFNRADEP